MTQLDDAIARVEAFMDRVEGVEPEQPTLYLAWLGPRFGLFSSIASANAALGDDCMTWPAAIDEPMEMT